MSCPIVYLDTQDYSRFGDVLRGKADAATEALFRELEQRKQAGAAIFAVSMPILGELLQYNEGFRETTLRKAEAVERLCGSWALAFPTRLIAGEIVAGAQQDDVLPKGLAIEILSPDRYWYPDVSNEFRGLRAKIQAGIGPELSTMGLSRKMRRGAAKLATKIDVGAVAREAAPQMAEQYGLPVEVFTNSIVALLQNRITPEQASRRLFGAIAEPVKFVEFYFEKVENDRTLPSWLSELGRDFEARLTSFRDALTPYLKRDDARGQIEQLLAKWPTTLTALPFRMAADELRSLGFDPERLQQLAADPAFAERIPAARIIGNVLPAYVRQITGLAGRGAKIERSFGGDLVHALFLPHVDLWRGDRRFSAVVSAAVPDYAERIVSTLKALPAAIDAWHALPAHN